METYTTRYLPKFKTDIARLDNPWRFQKNKCKCYLLYDINFDRHTVTIKSNSNCNLCSGAGVIPPIPWSELE